MFDLSLCKIVFCRYRDSSGGNNGNFEYPFSRQKNNVLFDYLKEK